MSLIQQIKNQQIEARKARDAVKASLLTTLLAEASAPGKNAGNRESTDEEVVSVVKKFIKNADETLAALPTSDARHPVVVVEKVILETFLPRQLTEADLREVLAAEVINLEDKSPKQMGKLMAVLKVKFAGQYDGALASKYVQVL